MNFFLVMKQRGTGCNYMIGCGMKYVHLKAENMRDARREASKEHHASDRGDTLEESLILQVGEVVDLLDGDEGSQAVTAKEYRALQKKIEKLKAKNEELSKDATVKTAEYRELARAMEDVFGGDFMDRVKMKSNTSSMFSGREVQPITSGDIFTKALDERASQLVAPKMKAKKKMASDFLERLQGAGSPQESAEIMQDVTNVLRRIAK